MKTTIALSLLIPLVSFAQVTIKEKVEIKQKIQSHPTPSALAFDFFSPPLFAYFGGSPVLTLASSLTMSGTLNIAGAIGGNQEAIVVYVGGQEHELAWKGRVPLPWGGDMYEGINTYSELFSAGACPTIALYLLDSQGWGDGAGQVAIGANGLEYSFTGVLNQGMFLPAVPVTATGSVSGSFLEWATFHDWQIEAFQYLDCASESPLTITPLDGTGRPYIPFSEPLPGNFTVSVQAKGPYAYLKCGDQEGQQVVMSVYQADQCYLVLDPQRGEIPEVPDTAIVTVTGGGKSRSMAFYLHCDKFNYLAIVASPDTLLLGSSAKLVVIAQDVYDHEIIPTEDFDVTLQVWPGSLSVTGGAPVPETVTVPYSLARAGRVQYVANEALSDGQDCFDVPLDVYRSSDGDKEGVAYVTIAQPYCAKVIVDPPKLAPGQTATVTFEKTGGNDMYDVSILANDSTSGVLISSSGGRGIALQGVTGTVQYVAPTSISADSVVVSISASSYGICGGIDMQSRVPLQAKKLPGVAATQSLRSGPPAVAHAASLQKKSAGHSMRLPLTADEQHALMMSIAKRVADNTCTLGEVVVENQRRTPTKIYLDVNPVQVNSRGVVELTVSLYEGKVLIDRGETGATIDFSLGDEGEKYASLNCVDPAAIGMRLTDVTHGTAVTVAIDKQSYDERFPLRIQVRVVVHQDPTLEADLPITLVGLHTLGKYFSQSDTWGGDVYDTYKHRTYDKKADSVDAGGNPVFWTIADKGCALSCMAMVLKAFGCDVDPRRLNDWMNEPNNHLAMNRRSGFGKNGNVDWEYVLQNYRGSTVGSSLPVNKGNPAPAPPAALDYNLSQGYPSIAMVRDQHSDGTFSEHWVVVTSKTLNGRYTILDPGHSDRTTLDPEKIYQYREIIPQ